MLPPPALSHTLLSATPAMASPTTTTTISLLLILLLFSADAQSPDVQPLLSFKSSADTSNKLTSWTPATDPCSSSSWFGVSCSGDRVSKLVLEDLSLTGSFLPLASLSSLRVLSLSHNLLSGPIPDLSNLTSLKLLFLSHNSLSGHLPASLSPRLFRLDLSSNNLSGPIPPAVNRLPHLLTLRLDSNSLSGPISDLTLPTLQDLNLSSNNLVGQIPRSLSSFPTSSFSSNPVLCGPPLPPCKASSTDPTRPGSSPKTPAAVVSSSPSSDFPPIPTKKPRTPAHHGGPRMSVVAIIALVVGDVLILALISLLLYCYFWRNLAAKKSTAAEKLVYSSSAPANACPYPYPVTNPVGGAHQAGLERGRMVFFEGARKFELEDLLRASAEMLGKGVTGTTYKAGLDDGSVVAVKRLKLEAATGEGKLKGEFEQHMEVLGRLRHPNVVALKAYYFAKEEKLLVSDFMPNSSLSWLLHGNRGPGRTPLDWTTRLKIASGAARGVLFIHSSCTTLRLTHGNIKSTNVLIDKAGDARVSDFGLSSFVPPHANGSKTNGYRAPEVVDGRKNTHRADVYSFGVLLLELLTGKCPSMVEGNGAYGRVGMGGAVDLPRWVQSVVREEWTAEVFDLELMRYKDIEEEMVGLLQIAMACTSASPDQRPKMAQVVKMIDEIRGGTEVSPSHDDSVDSPSVSEETCGVSQ